LRLNHRHANSSSPKPQKNETYAMRSVKDFIREKEPEDNVLYRIPSVKACNNYPDNSPIHPEWYKVDTG